jgi:phosphate transport system substrate-binding protein
MTRRRLRAVAFAALWAACLAAICSADAAPRSPVPAGVVRCAGGSTMLPLVRSWGRQFHARYPRARVEVDARITLAAEGFRALLAGRADLVDFVREPFPAETAAFARRFGYPLLLINVANGSFATRGGTHAIAIYVNSSNPLRQLTLGQLEEIFSAAPPGGSRSRIDRWGGVGLGGRWASRPIHVYGMTPLRPSGNPPGIVNFMEIRVLHGGRFRPDLRIGRDRPGDSALQAIVQAVANDPDGIGYSGFAYALPGVKAIALAKLPGEPYVDGSPEQVATRAYPLARQIYFGINSPPGRPLPPLVKAFIELALSPEGQREIARTPAHFLPLLGQQLARSHRQLLAPAASGPVVSVIGYNDMREMLLSLDALFARQHPGARFALVLKGTRTAPAALAAGRSLLAPMGAPFSPRELAAYRREVGADPVALRIAHDSLSPHARSAPLAVFVPAANPLPALTFAQLQRIFAAGDGRLRWGQLGVTGALANRPVHPYGLAAATALGRFMRRHALAGRPFADRFTGFPESTDVVRRVGNDPLGIGFAAMNRATAAVRMVPLSRRPGEPPSRGTRADLLAGRYPLDRCLLIYVRIRPGGHLDPIARAYLRLALSREGQRAIASGHLGYLPLSPAQAAAQRAKLDALP